MISLLLLVIFLLTPLPVESSGNTKQTDVIKQAETLVGSDKPQEAIKALGQYKPANEERSSYNYIYAKACEKTGNLYESMARLRLSYLYAPDGAQKERILLERAGLYFKMGYYPEAVLGYRQFLRTFPNSAQTEQARLGIADSLNSQGLFIEALLNYEEAGDSPRALFGKANVYHGIGRYNDAHNMYMTAIGKDMEYLKSSPETLYSMAENFRLMGKPVDARGYYSAINHPLIKKKAEIGLGLIATDEAKYDAAINHFNSAMESSDRKIRAGALIHLAEAYIKSGRQEEAKARLMEIKNKYPYTKDYDGALLKLSRIYKSEGKFNEAVSYLKELASKRSPDKETLDEFEKILLEAKSGSADEFLKLWNSFGRLLLDPSRAQSLMEIATGLRSSGKPFLDLCSWLVKKGPPEAKTQCSLSLADFYADMGDAGKAAAYMKGIKGSADETLRIRAKIYRENRDYQKAMETVLSLKEMKPTDIVFFAELLETSKDVKKAVEFCDRALKNIGAPLKVYIKLGDTLYGMGREAEALKFYGIVASLKPENRKDLSSEDTGWTYYMVSKLSGEKTAAADLPASAQKGNSIYGKSAEAAVKEADIRERMKRIF
jgi:tetratricopeptide (TPR) repeat protein